MFAPALKAAKVIPVPKTKDLTDPNNFRPISPHSILSYFREKHGYEHRMLSIEDHNLFRPFQSGFCRHHSCYTALIRLCNTWLSVMNKTQRADTVFLDLKKGFDY